MKYQRTYLKSFYNCGDEFRESMYSKFNLLERGFTFSLNGVGCFEITGITKEAIETQVENFIKEEESKSNYIGRSNSKS